LLDSVVTGVFAQMTKNYNRSWSVAARNVLCVGY